MAPTIKICCIASIEEATLAVRSGASVLGLVSAMPSGPGVIDEAAIAEIAERVPPAIETFLLTALVQADAIAEQHARCRTSALQLVDHVEEDELVRLRRALPRVRLVQVGVRESGALSVARLDAFVAEVRDYAPVP